LIHFQSHINKMNYELLQFCSSRGILVDKQVLQVLEVSGNLDLSKRLLDKIILQFNQKIITKGFFSDNKHQLYDLLSYHSGKDKELIQNIFINLGLTFNQEIIDSNKKEKSIDVLEDNFGVNLLRIYQNTPKKLEVKDFINNFKYRFNFLKSILMERQTLDNLISINRISGRGNCSLIAIVYDKKVTKNGNILLELEDLTGRVRAIINKDRKEVYEKSKEIILDEVIGVKCSGNGEIVFVNDILFPDAKILKKKYSNKEEYVAFTSDIHVGSNNFLEKEFLKFIDWINGNVGNEKQKSEALKVKYLFITGDSVDGVGVYPGQESQLILKDVEEQYAYLRKLLGMIRSDVQIIHCAGQHDAVRVAEPQPIVGESYGEILKELKNLHRVTNPSLIEIGKDVKFKVLMYHGASMHGVINSIDSLRLGKGHDSPTNVVKYLLKKRHLAPTHSLVTYTPLDNEDALLIKEIPDIITTGDLHRPEIANYNGILLISSSCWQAKTPFEEKVGNNPDPCKVPIFNLKTREIKIFDFSGIEGSEKNAN